MGKTNHHAHLPFPSVALLLLVSILLTACSPGDSKPKEISTSATSPKIADSTIEPSTDDTSSEMNGPAVKPFTDDEANSQFGYPRAILYSAYRSAAEATVGCMLSQGLKVVGPLQNINDFRYLQWSYTTTNKQDLSEENQTRIEEIEKNCEDTYLEEAAVEWAEAQRLSPEQHVAAKNRILSCLAETGINVESNIGVEQLAEVIEESGKVNFCARRDIEYFDMVAPG